MKRYRRRRRKLPVEPIELEIDRLSHDGRGVASIDGKVGFVSGALPGELVRAQYTNKRSQFDELKTLEVLRPAASRIVPECQYADICGGCSLQHFNSDAQIDFKNSALHEHLKHNTGLTQFTALEPILSSSHHYRRKARLGVRYVHKKEDVLIGFREKNSSFITDMSSCSVLVEPVSELLLPLRELIMDLDSRSTIPQIEVAVGERDEQSLHIALIFRHLQALSNGDQNKLKEFARCHALDLYLQPKGPDTIHKLWPENSPDRLQYFLPEFDLTMSFHPGDFTQVNGQINRKIITLAVELLELQDTDNVLDLFCGMGNFTLPMARHSHKVVGVEGSDVMVARAQQNAMLNGIDNTCFYAADLCLDFSNEPWANSGYDKILLDPPRCGAIEIIRQVAKIGARKIVYISCNPATLARDAMELTACGYSLLRAGVMDMFPHTSHVESIAEFVLKKC